MDGRTIRIRELKYKLENARELIRELAIQCVEMGDGKTLNKAYWGKKAILKLESTKD